MWRSWTYLQQFLLWEGVVLLKELTFQFLLWDGVLVSQELIFNSFYLAGGGSVERTDFSQFLYWEAVVVLKKTEF